MMKQLIENLVKTKDMGAWHYILTRHGFCADDVNADYDSAVGICYSSDGDYYAEMMLFPADDCLYDEDADEEENEAYSEYVDACGMLEWGVISSSTIKGYVYMEDADGEEILGYKDFGITDEEFNRLSCR